MRVLCINFYVLVPLHFLAQEADLVFSPYSYLVDPVIRRALDIGKKGGFRN